MNVLLKHFTGNGFIHYNEIMRKSCLSILCQKSIFRPSILARLGKVGNTLAL